MEWRRVNGLIDGHVRVDCNVAMSTRSLLCTAAALTLFSTCIPPLSAQAPQPTPDGPAGQTVTRNDLPPSAIYTETLAPAEAVHEEIANWSDIEIAAYTAAMTTAKAECKRLEQSPHEGEEGLAMARLCSLGQDWDGTYSAARWYTRESAPPAEAEHLPLGFGLLLQADLSVPLVRRAMDDLAEMNRRLPLTADTDSVFNFAIRGLEVTQPEAGLTAAMLRLPSLLTFAGGTAGAAPAISAGPAEAECWHTLALLHMAHREAEELSQREALLAAIAARTHTLPAAEAYLAARARAQYEWLGKPMPRLQTTRDTSIAVKAVPKPLPAKARLLVVERDGAPDVAALASGVDALRGRLQPGMQASLVLVPAARVKDADTTLSKPLPVHAVYTTDPLLDTFSVNGGPLFLVVDAKGKVAFVSVGTAAWLNAQMQAEVLLDRTSEQDKAVPAKDAARPK